MQLASAACVEERLEDALRHTDRAVQLAPTAPTRAVALCFRGAIKCALQDFDAALLDLQPGVQQLPNESWAWRWFGVAQLKLGRHTSALDALDRAVNLAPGDGVALMHRGSCRLKLGQYAQALVDLNTVVVLAPRDDKAWCERARVQFALGQFVSALSDFERAIELFPRDTYALVSCMGIHKILGQIEEAASAANRARHIVREQQPLEWDASKPAPCGADGCIELLMPGVRSCCPNCERVYYCCRACQKADWRAGHKRMCSQRVSAAQ